MWVIELLCIKIKMPRITQKQLRERKVWFSNWLEEKEDKMKNWLKSFPSETQVKLDYSPESLLFLETLILDSFSSSDIFNDKSNTQAIDCFGTYIGETHIRNHSIELTWDCDFDNLEYDSRVSFFPFLTSNYVNCSHPINMAYVIHNRLGDDLFKRYNFAEKRFSEAKKENRLKTNLFIIEDKGHSYDHFIFNDSINFSKLRSAVNKFYKNKEVVSRNNNKNHIILKFNNSYHFHFSLNNSGSVLTESQEMATDFKELPQNISNCKQRVEFWGDEDMNGNYLNESLLILEHITSNLQMMAIDIKTGTYLK